MLFVLALAGCASLATTNLTPPQRDGLARAEAFIQRAGRAYDRRPIPVRVRYLPPPIGATYEGSEISISQLYVARIDDALLAHEAGHWLLGHRPARWRWFTSAEVIAATQADMELEANHLSVEILARVQAISEAEALRVVYDRLLKIHHGELAYGLIRDGRGVHGRYPACREIQDLIARFPQQRGWTTGLVCADGSSPKP